jgi:hypothetical protein
MDPNCLLDVDLEEILDPNISSSPSADFLLPERIQHLRHAHKVSHILSKHGHRKKYTDTAAAKTGTMKRPAITLAWYDGTVPLKNLSTAQSKLSME